MILLSVFTSILSNAIYDGFKPPVGVNQDIYDLLCEVEKEYLLKYPAPNRGNGNNFLSYRENVEKITTLLFDENIFSDISHSVHFLERGKNEPKVVVPDKEVDFVFEKIRELIPKYKELRSCHADMNIIRSLSVGNSNDETQKVALKVNNTPAQYKGFWGRENELEKIENIFQNNSTITIIAGGGYGKSQLTVAYARKHESEYDQIWFVNAATKAELIRSYAEFYARVSPVAKKVESADDVNAAQSVKRWLEEHNRFLFVYENTEGFLKETENSKVTRDLLLPVNPRGKILYSSRDRENKRGELLELDVFPKERGYKFFKSEYVKKEIGEVSDIEAKEIANLLGNLPIAMASAVKNMIETHNSPKMYIARLKRRGLQELDEFTPDDYDKVLSAVWKENIEAFTHAPKGESADEAKKRRAAYQLFSLCAYCAPDNIPLSLFWDAREYLPKELHEELKNGNELKLFKLLSHFSLITYKYEEDSEVYFLSIHRLIQAVVRNEFASGQDKCNGFADCWLVNCLNIARHVFEDNDGNAGNAKAMEAFKKYVSHAIEIANHAGDFICEQMEVSIKRAWLYNKIGEGYYCSAQFDEALKYYKMVASIGDCPVTARLYNNFGKVYASLGRFCEDQCNKNDEYDKKNNAYDNFSKALALNEKALYKELENTIITNNDLGGNHLCRKLYDEALEYYNKALKFNEVGLNEINFTSNNPQKNPHYATAYHNIAGVYNQRGQVGDYEKALEYYKKALEARKELCALKGEYSQQNLAATHNNMGVVYYKQGDYVTALSCYKKAQKIHEEFFPQHMNTAFIYNNMAAVYVLLEDYSTATALYKKACDILNSRPQWENHRLTTCVKKNFEWLDNMG